MAIGLIAAIHEQQRHVRENMTEEELVMGTITEQVVANLKRGRPSS